MLTLFQHQAEFMTATPQLHLNHKNICAVCPTGGGKTIMISAMAKRYQEQGKGVLIMAHRDVLLEQISAALCMNNVYHSLYCSKPTITEISNLNLAEFGNSYYRETSTIIVASVDTLYRRDLSQILPFIHLWIMDEGHHMTKGSKWHKCIELFDEAPHCHGLLMTATPIRADRKGLGRHASGVADALYVICDMETLILRGRLSPYKIFVPENLIDTDSVKITNSGDYNRDQLAAATDKGHITGSVIETYKNIANGKRTIVFTVNIAHSNHVAAQFRAAGINAVSLSSEDGRAYRAQVVKDFRAGRITVLVNCDLFGEGFDVPAVEVVISLRKTLSYSVFKQQFGRMLRVIDGKLYGMFIDHVGNVPYFMQNFGLSTPHDDPEWTLDDGEKKGGGGGGRQFETITCKNCRAFYVPSKQAVSNVLHKKGEKINSYDECPECAHEHTTDEVLDEIKKFQERQGKIVELELKLDIFKELIAKREQVDESPEAMRNRMKYAGAPAIAYNSAYANQAKRRNAQVVLRSLIQQWGERCYKRTGYPLPIIQREFELAFQIPVIKAQVLSETEALKLSSRIQESLNE